MNLNEDLKFQAKQAFQRAAKAQEMTHTMLRNRPHDVVKIVDDGNSRDSWQFNAEKKQEQQHCKQEHCHFVRMGFNELPKQMQQNLLAMKSHAITPSASRLDSTINSGSVTVKPRKCGLKKPTKSSNTTIDGKAYGNLVAPKRSTDSTAGPRRVSLIANKFDRPKTSLQGPIVSFGNNNSSS